MSYPHLLPLPQRKSKTIRPCRERRCMAPTSRRGDGKTFHWCSNMLLNHHVVSASHSKLLLSFSITLSDRGAVLLSLLLSLFLLWLPLSLWWCVETSEPSLHPSSVHCFAFLSVLYGATFGGDRDHTEPCRLHNGGKMLMCEEERSGAVFSDVKRLVGFQSLALWSMRHHNIHTTHMHIRPLQIAAESSHASHSLGKAPPRWASSPCKGFGEPPPSCLGVSSTEQRRAEQSQSLPQQCCH